MISDEKLKEWEVQSKQKSGSAILYTDNTTHNDRIGILARELRAERKARKILQDVLQKMQREAANANINGCVITKKYVDSTVEKALADVDKILKGSGE